MGSNFCSIARWFMASSHSLLIVLGGGGAVKRAGRCGVNKCGKCEELVEFDMGGNAYLET